MGSNLDSGWSDDAVKRAQLLWRDGLTAGQIAKELGVSRNAVCGKTYRHPEIFPPRGKTGGASAVRRTVEKLRGPRPAAPRVTAEKRDRTPPQQKARPEPVDLPSGWVDRNASRFDLDRFQRECFAPVAFVSLAHGQCHFPLAAFDARGGPDMPCCAAPVAGGDRYCAEHRQLMTGGR